MMLEHNTDSGVMKVQARDLHAASHSSAGHPRRFGQRHHVDLVEDSRNLLPLTHGSPQTTWTAPQPKSCSTSTQPALWVSSSYLLAGPDPESRPGKDPLVLARRLWAPRNRTRCTRQQAAHTATDTPPAHPSTLGGTR